MTISLESRQTRERALELLEQIRPLAEELHTAAVTVRDDVDAILVALYPIFGDVTDEMFDLAFTATGFEEVWDGCRGIADLFDDTTKSGMSTSGLEAHEIARGGERDFPRGTVASVVVGDEQKPMTVEVEWGPRHPLAEGGYIVRNVETGREYIVSHDKLKAGLDAVTS